MKTATQMLIAFQIEYVNENQVIDWAISFFEQNPIDESHSLIEIISINRKAQRNTNSLVYLQQYVNFYYPDFEITSKDAENYAKSLFKDKLQNYLYDEEYKPYDILKMIYSIEGLYDYPTWLGNMFHACDWTEPDSLRTDFPHIEDEIVITLREFL